MPHFAADVQLGAGPALVTRNAASLGEHVCIILAAVREITDARCRAEQNVRPFSKGQVTLANTRCKGCARHCSRSR